jgi:hypothetical protein
VGYYDSAAVGTYDPSLANTCTACPSGATTALTGSDDINDCGKIAIIAPRLALDQLQRLCVHLGSQRRNTKLSGCCRQRIKCWPTHLFCAALSAGCIEDRWGDPAVSCATCPAGSTRPGFTAGQTTFQCGECDCSSSAATTSPGRNGLWLKVTGVPAPQRAPPGPIGTVQGVSGAWPRF